MSRKEKPMDKGPKIIAIPMGSPTVACMKCGWCCEISQCHIWGYLYGEPEAAGTCDKLVPGDKPFEKVCGLYKDEPDLWKRANLKRLIGMRGCCTHRFGPHPVRTLESIVAAGHLNKMEDLNNYFGNMVSALRYAIREARAPKDVFSQAAKELAVAVEKEAARLGYEVFFGDQIADLLTVEDVHFTHLMEMLISGTEGGNDIRN